MPMDPFSIVTGIAGLVSLGLTVSGGLIQYCRDYKSQDTDLVKLTQHAQELESLLSLIESRTAGSQGPSGDITTSLQKCRDACDDCLWEFKRLNAKYAGSKPNQTFNGRSRKLVHDLKYPFDKGKFDDCRSQLQEFNAKLLGYLQLVNLDVTRDMRCTMILEFAQVTTAVDSAARQLQLSITNTNNAVTSTIRDGVDQLEESFRRSLRGTEENMTSSLAVMGRGQERQISEMSTITRRLDQISQMIQNQNMAQTSSTSVENRIALDMYKMSNTFQDSSSIRTPSSIMSGRAILCDCPKARHGYSSTRHRKDCLYSFANKKKQTFSTRFQAFRHQVIWTWQVEYSPLAWARSWQIHRNLTLRATVPRSAPSFELMLEIESKLYDRKIVTIQELGSVLQDYLGELQLIFANGKGWPTDVDEYGDNLLHEALRSIYWYLDVLEPKRDEELSTIFLQFINTLVLMGVPINDMNDHGKTPLRTAINYNIFVDNALPVWANVINKLIDMEATINESYIPYEIMNFLSINNPDVYDDFSCTEFLYEVLLRSESSFVRLRADPSLIFERTKGGQTAFHLAANWPKGISTLIECAGWEIKSIINANDTYEMTALEYAIELDEPGSVRLLLDAGAIITESLFYTLGNIRNENREVMQIIITYLAQQQKGLLKLALQNLPVEIVDKLELKEDEILDFDDKAFDVAEALRQQQVPIPDTYYIPKLDPVYYRLACSASITQMLFDAGFQRTNMIFAGYTPLMTLSYYHRGLASYLELVYWFEDHGTDLRMPIPIPGHYTIASNPERLEPVHPAIHKVSYELGKELFFSTNKSMKLSTKMISRFAKLLQDEYADPCLCYCTPNGCTSASKYVHAFYGEINGISISERAVDGIKLTEAMTGHNLNTVASGLIRVMTFEELGMKHTCCRYRNKRYYSLQEIIEEGLLILMEPAEIEEIREEDRYLAEQLDSLMEEFEAKLQEMGVPLSSFVENCWLPRMEEVKKERDKLSAGESQAMKEIGVVLEES